LVKLKVLNLFECRPLLWVLAKHADAQVLEVLRAIGAADLAPVFCEVSFLHHVVEVLVWLGFSEGENSLDENEEDHSSRENVDFSAIVALPLLDLWCHVRLSSEILS